MDFEAFLAKLKGYAEAAWAAVSTNVEKVIEENKPVLDKAFEALVEGIGQFVTNKIVELMDSAYDKMSGSEKHNLVATQATEEAQRLGIAAKPADISTLVKTSYITAAAAAGKPA